MTFFWLDDLYVFITYFWTKYVNIETLMMALLRLKHVSGDVNTSQQTVKKSTLFL
jgi:hypothetical protein